MANPNKRLKVERTMRTIPAEYARLVTTEIDIFKRNVLF